ncbi:MAG TPA: tagaturonate epimerase family protein [Bacteroidota bacterium]|nr:tagaturonate epimerase family protein [Bacteroidota bacterium]
MTLGTFSIGIGDRFGLQGVYQLRAVQQAAAAGVEVSPVWNKSQREHAIIGTTPEDTRREADASVREAGWRGAYFVDADHIGADTVGRFLGASDFFTIDVAEFIGSQAPPGATRDFTEAMRPFAGEIRLPGLAAPVRADAAVLGAVAARYLNAVQEAGRVYRRIREGRTREFIAEVSLDESNLPQSAGELFFILGALAREKIPLGTIAPKFTGAFLKGVDYVGDTEAFARQFEEDLAVVAFAREAFGLPAGLKLSVHTGSDKFSLYPLMHRALRRLGAGLHLKTAGTTWVEEVVSLAEAGGEGLRAANAIYARSFERLDELCSPYRQVIAIERRNLPSPSDVARWPADKFARALRHEPGPNGFNRDIRQLVHVGYRIAAEMGDGFTSLVREHAERVGANVADNLYRKHIVPLFIGP